MRSIRTLAMILLLAGPVPVLAADAPASTASKAGVAQPGEESDYIVGPGDGLQILVYGEPALTTAVTVRPDGKISMQLVEDLKVVGITPSQLSRLVEQRLADTGVRNPKVTVIVTNALSEYSKITVIGEVANQQSVPYYQGMTVLDVVLRVGGLGDFANGNGAKIIRKDASGKQQEIPVRLGDLIKKGRVKENVALKPGDMVVVPESKL